MPATMSEAELETISLSRAAQKLRMTRATLMRLAMVGQVAYAVTLDQQIRFVNADIENLAKQSRRPSMFKASMT